MQSREQQFAARIFEQVKAYGDQHPVGSSERKKYGSMAHKLPILVRSAGLVQALAFVHSRGKEPYQKLLEHVAQVVIDDDASALLKESREAKLSGYISLTERTMLALKWYKRFAQSELKVEPTDEGV